MTPPPGQSGAARPARIAIGDIGTIRVARVLTAHPELPQHAAERAADIERAIFGGFDGGSTIEPSVAAPLLEGWLGASTTAMAEILQTDSKAFWLFLHRRLSSLRTTHESNRTVLICDEFATLAIMQFGKNDGTEFTAAPQEVRDDWLSADVPELLPVRTPVAGSRILPRSIPVDRIAAIVEFDRIVHGYWACTALLRRVWKGASLRVHDGRIRRPVDPPGGGPLISLYDKRTDESGVLAHVGLTASLATMPDLAREVPMVTWSVSRNLDHIDRQMGWLKGNTDSVTYEPGFLLLPVNLDEYTAQTEPFRAHIESVLGVDPWRIAALLAALFWRFYLVWREHPEGQTQYETQGYGLFGDRAQLEGDLEPIYAVALRSLGLDGDASAEVPRLLDWLTYSDANLAEIDLWSRSGRKLFLSVPHGYLLDLGALPNILAEVASPIATVDTATGARKGMLFENLVARDLRKISRLKFPFRNQVAHSLDGSDVGEIDIGVVRENTLFIVECKAHSVHPTWEKGTPEALAKRWDIELKYLEQATRLATAIANRQTDIAFPHGVTHIVAFVVSPFAAYVPRASPEWFLNTDTPRLCTPDEAREFVRSYRMNRYRGAPWHLPIKPP